MTTYRLISRQEAAEMLHCDEQTVSNWVARGVIKGRKLNGRTYVDAATIEAILDDANVVARTQKNIRLMRERAEADYQMATKELNDISLLREAFGFKLPAPVGYHVAVSIVDAMNEYGALSDRDANIVKRVMGGSNLRVIAEDFDIGMVRLRQILFSALRRIVRAATDIRLTKIPEYKNAIKERDLEILQLRAEIIELKKCVPTEKANVEPLDLNMAKILSTDLFEEDFSVRCLNCFRFGDIRTLGDLVKHKETDLCRLHGFGKKSLLEITDYLEYKSETTGCNLYLGMKVPDVIKENKLL